MSEKKAELLPPSVEKLKNIKLDGKLIDTVSTFEFDSIDSFDFIVKEIAKSIDDLKRIELIYRDKGDFDSLVKLNKSKVLALKDLTDLIALRKKLYGAKSVDLEALEFKIVGQYFIETLKKTFSSFCHKNSLNADSNFVNQFLSDFSIDLQGWQSEVYKRIEKIKAE